jgi:hypothetical protein
VSWGCRNDVLQSRGLKQHTHPTVCRPGVQMARGHGTPEVPALYCLFQHLADPGLPWHMGTLLQTLPLYSRGLSISPVPKLRPTPHTPVRTQSLGLRLLFSSSHLQTLPRQSSGKKDVHFVGDTVYPKIRSCRHGGGDQALSPHCPSLTRLRHSSSGPQGRCPGQGWTRHQSLQACRSLGSGLSGEK